MGGKKGLTDKQEQFVHALLDGLSQADAYRVAYSSDGMKATTVRKKASLLANMEKIKERKKELEERMANRFISKKVYDIASEEEIKQFWTDTMRDTNEEMKHRNKSSELLAKSKQMLTDKVKHEGDVSLTQIVISK